MNATTTHACEEIEGIRRDAAALLSLIERCGIEVGHEFLATLRKLADNPVREGYIIESPRLRRQFDRDIEAMAIAAMTDHQVEQSWYRWRLAQEAAC